MQHPRHDLYGPIHKALRKQACELLVRTGQADFADEATRVSLVEATRKHLAFISLHLWHEESFIHPAARARDARLVEDIEDEHAGHGEAVRDLQRHLALLDAASSDGVAMAGHQVYLSLARLVAHDLAHMDQEESFVQPLLQGWFDDTALQGMMAAIIASMPHEELLDTLRAMLPALNANECAHIVGGVLATLPSAIAEGFLPHVVQPLLAPHQYARLIAVLDRSSHPGAVDRRGGESLITELRNA